MKKILSTLLAVGFVFAAFVQIAPTVEAANAVRITVNDTIPDVPDTTNDYWNVRSGASYAISIKGTFDSASLDIQEAYIDAVSGAEVWASIGGKDAVTAAEDFQFVAIGNKVRIVVTSAGASCDIDVIGPIQVAR